MGNKINYVHNKITQSDIAKQTNHESFKKAFEPITNKLDDVMTSNLKKRPLKRRQPKKEAANGGFDYAPEVDPYEDVDVGC